MANINHDKYYYLNRWLSESEAKPVLLLFTTSWSGSAHLVTSNIKNVLRTNDTPSEFHQVDIEKQPDLAAHFDIYHIPTIVIIYRREIVDYFSGMINKKKLRGKLEQIG